MSIKEEIKKLVDSKRNAHEQADLDGDAFQKLLEERFSILKPLLEEVANSIDRKYLEYNFNRSSAYLSLLHPTGETYVTWSISPNYETYSFPVKYKFNEGYTVEEIWRFTDPEYDISELHYKFKGEPELIDHIVEKITDHIAHCEFIKKRQKKYHSSSE